MSEKKVIIDLRGALLSLERVSGERKNVSDVAKHYDITRATLTNWDKEAPKVVKFIRDFMVDTGCKFEDIVKEV